ncbi:Protein dachsous [Frankliniella fusca]|uniref:Protein dachsous n=1 Tax=Frankliniella fusca TaxID=407009 RepID=A0AAE1LAC2_9NEOP|nr:Protein dachsous [Frankliniella fusca]
MDGSKFVVVDPSKPIPKEKECEVDWELCVLCQKDDGSKLIIPSKNSNAEKFQGYSKLDKLLRMFDSAGLLSSLPFEIKISKLNNGSGIYETLKINNAVYHKYCLMKCSDREYERALKRKSKETVQSNSPVKTRRCSSGFDQTKCLFCDKTATRKQPLINVTTVSISSKIKNYAVLLKDTSLMAKVNGAHDLIALEACYHSCCLTTFNNRIRAYDNKILSASKSTELPSNLSELHAYGLAHLASHIDDVRESTIDGLPVFKMTDLAKCYSSYMKEMGVDHVPHTSRLRDRLLAACPHLQASGSAGQDTLITYSSDSNVSIRAAVRDFNTDAFRFTDVAKVVRSDIFSKEKARGWEETLDKQAESTPLSLKTLLSMIMRGPGSFASITEEEADFDQVINSIAQLISYHAVKRVSKSTDRRISSERETPVPVYLAMKIYGESRSKTLVNLTHELGLSISYKRLQAILNDKASVVSQRYAQTKVVCPPTLYSGDFTVGAVDNIDHDTSSYTAKTSFHGTAITLMQFPDAEAPGGPQEMMQFEPKKGHSIDLPDTYALVKPCDLNVKSIKVPSVERCTIKLTEDASPIHLGKLWLDTQDDTDILPWPVYNSRAENDSSKCLTRTAVLPLFSEQAHSVEMMVHAMDCVTSAIHYINPGQTPVLVADQPLYALCRSIQCLRPDTYGEEKMFIMMGSLHIEMAILRALGSILENSGWVGALVHAAVTTQGRAESMLRASHVTRTRYAHEVTVAVLYYLQRLAYEQHKENNDEDDPIFSSFEEWRVNKCSTVPQFKFWDIVLNVELTLLQFIASLRSANFKMYKHALCNMIGWFFALDQVNYARWLSVHIRDLVNLDTTHPDLAAKFEAGSFVARKSHRPFSSIGLDQNHEQVNATLKGNGGMIGLTQRPESLTKLLLTIPELASIISKFETANFDPRGRGDESVHHSDNGAFIRLFQRDYESLKSTFLLWGNPFSEDGTELYNIQTNMKAPLESSEILQRIEMMGKSQYETFVQERLESSQKLVTDTIPQNKISIWKEKAKGVVEKNAAKLLALKSDCELFRKLFIVCQAREYDLDEFFKYENQPWPPSLSALGQIRCVGKSDIMKSLINPVPDSVHLQDAPLPAFDAKVYDGPALVHMLPPGRVRTFQEYADKVFCAFIARECSPSVKRVDVVWDTYSDTSLKSAARDKRGHGDRFQVNSTTSIPHSWPNFLRDSNNKKQLFSLLAKSLQSLFIPGVEVYSTTDSDVVCSSSAADLSFISPCNHEEADSRMILHVADASRKGLKTCMIRTSDSDVLVLAVAYAKQIESQTLWVSIGTGKHHQLINATAISEHLGPEKSSALPVVHAFSGCDTTSSFLSKGKKSVMDTWSAYPQGTEGFLALRRGAVDEGLPVLERLVVKLYCSSSKCNTVNECRRDLFTKKARAPECLPPSQDALRQHCRRAAYQGGIVWGQCLQRQQRIPDPSLWGWEKSANGPFFWTPKWTTLGQIQQNLLVLMRCGCKKGCSPVRCNCKKSLLPCTEMCECNGECE